MAWSQDSGGNWQYSGPTQGSGLPGDTSGAIAPPLGTTTNPTPAPVAKTNLFPTSIPTDLVSNPAITPVALGSPGSTPVATGVDLFMQMMDFVLKSETLRMSSVDQAFNITKYATSLAGVSPTQAANLAVSMGIPGLEPDLSFANRFVNQDSTGSITGKAGSQDLKLPFSFSGKELSFLGQNKNFATQLQDVASYLGKPDLFASSAGSLIPSGGGLFKF